nr:MAG TPA: hypothetical protein [Caudoviricetes sp.]
MVNLVCSYLLMRETCVSRLPRGHKHIGLHKKHIRLLRG